MTGHNKIAFWLSNEDIVYSAFLFSSLRQFNVSKTLNKKLMIPTETVHVDVFANNVPRNV